MEKQEFLAASVSRQLWSIYEAASGVASEGEVPAHDYIEMSYYGSTNNVHTVTYKKAGTTVATWTMAYVGGTPSTNDAKLLSVTKT